MHFKSILQFWLFAERVIENTRYRYSPRDEEFLDAVRETGSQRIITLPLKTVLYRAQLDHRTERNTLKNVYRPSAPSRMKPEPKSAKEGRVNPKGIPCLYLADNPQTAMSEVRPWLGAYVSIGHFETTKDLKLMDCTVPKQYSRGYGLRKQRQPPRELEEWVWSEISNAFSEPVTDSDKTANYAPTQILSEVFRQIGCDGIKYRSLLGEGGHSFALFNLDDAKMISCGLCTVEKIHHPDFSEEEKIYALTEDGKEVERILPEADLTGMVNQTK
jgi:hypothetical protein